MNQTTKILKTICVVQALLLIAAIVTIVLLSVRVTDISHQNSTVIVPTSDENSVTTTTAPQTTQTTGDTAYTDIRTPYGTVKFPSAFTDVRYQNAEQDGVYSLSFVYVRDEGDAEAFSIHFGDEQNGTLIGYIEQNDVMVPFTVTSADASVDESWASEEQEYFRELMMAVNDVIASVQAWDHFVG